LSAEDINFLGGSAQKINRYKTFKMERQSAAENPEDDAARQSKEPMQPIIEDVDEMGP
jgi:hypothetical protein